MYKNKHGQPRSKYPRWVEKNLYKHRDEVLCDILEISHFNGDDVKPINKSNKRLIDMSGDQMFAFECDYIQYILEYNIKESYAIINRFSKKGKLVSQRHIDLIDPTQKRYVKPKKYKK